MGEVRKEIVREIIERVDIVEVISEFVSLRKIGKDWYAICPFHPDTKPSMRIREDKKVFNCFGCNVGGNVITFISKIKNISFQEAVRYLAERYIPDIAVEVDREWWSEKKKIVQANAHILFLLRKYFASKDGKVAREYLKSRGVDEDMWGKFAIGYAPADPYIIPAQLAKEGFQNDILKATGSIKEVEGRLHFIFRNKVVFPITNTKGEVVAFGGRVIDENITPKYINSAESPVFKKRDSFFGIIQAIDEIRLSGRCIIVEGYFDVISLHRAGVKYAVSCLGTAVSSAHIGFLKRIATDIIIMFDGDDAGKRATIKNIEVFARAGIIPKIIVLPQGEDPDTFIRRGGNIGELKSCDGILFIADQLLYEPLRTKDTISISRALAKIQELISIIYHESEAQAEIYIKEIAERVGISPQLIKGDVRRRARPLIPTQITPKIKNIPEYELEILRFALHKKEAIKYIKDFLDYISSDEIKEAINIIEQAGGVPSLALSLSEGETRKLMIDMLIEDREYPEIGWEELLESTLKRLAQEKIRNELQKLAKEAPHDPIKKQRYLTLLKKLSILEDIRAKRRRKKF